MFCEKGSAFARSRYWETWGQCPGVDSAHRGWRRVAPYRSPSLISFVSRTFPSETRMSVVSLWLAHFDLTASHPNLQARLSVHGWSVSHMAIVKGKSRGVIRTFNTVPDQFAFRKRPTEMRAGFCQREDSLSTTNK